MILTHHILEKIIGYLPLSCIKHLKGTPFEEYAFNHAFSEVEVDYNDIHDYLEDSMDDIPMVSWPGIRPDLGSSRSFRNVYLFRRFLEEHPFYRPRTIQFKQYRDIMIILKSHAHILREAQIHYSEKPIGDHDCEKDHREYIERIKRGLALPCRFKRVDFKQQGGPITWGNTTFRIPESICEVDFQSWESRRYYRGFVEGLTSLSLTKTTLCLPEAPPPSLFLPSLRILQLTSTIHPESFCMGNMPNLRELILEDVNSTCESLDLSELSIVKLKLEGLGVKSLEQVAFPQTLRELIIAHLKIQDLRGIQVPLTYLEVMWCEEIKALEFPDTLRKLNLRTVGKETRTASDKFLDHSVKLPKNLYSLSINWGAFLVRGTLELPPMLTDLDLSCCCLELPRLPDSIEYLKVNTQGIKSLEGVVWPRQLVSLSVKDMDLDAFPCHSLLGLDRLREVYVAYNGKYQKRFERALRTGEVNSIVRNLGSIRLRKGTAKYKVKYDNSAKTPDGSLSSLENLSFSKLKMVFREGFLVSLSCPEGFDLTEIPETVEVLRSKGTPPERIPSSLKELDHSIVFDRAQKLFEQLSESMEQLRLYCKGDPRRVSFPMQLPKLQKLSLNFPVLNLSEGCPNLTAMNISNTKSHVMDLDKFPCGLVSLHATHCEMEEILGSFVRFEKLEWLWLSSNYLEDYLAENILELPPSVVLLDLSHNLLTEMAGVRIGNRMDVVNLLENPGLAWQALANICEQVRPRSGSVLASLKVPAREFYPDEHVYSDVERGEEEEAEIIEQLREYIDEELMVDWL